MSEECVPAPPANETTVTLLVIHGDKKLRLQVNRDWSIQYLKQLCLSHIHMADIERFKLLSNGTLLSDTDIISSLDVGDTTALQVNIVEDEEESNSLTFSPRPKHLLFRFHVFCHTCDDVRPAKLQVLCESCGLDTFHMLHEPNDYQSSGEGICHNHAAKCPGRSCRFELECVNQPPVLASEEERHCVQKLWFVSGNFEHAECPACSEAAPVVVNYPCRHFLCLPCFRAECVYRFYNNRFVAPDRTSRRCYTVPCPEGCAGSFIPDAHYFRVCGAEFYAKYKQKATEMLALQDSVFYCPHCGLARKPSKNGRRVVCRVEAKGCGSEFCRLCHLPLQECVCSDETDGEATSNSSADTKRDSHRESQLEIARMCRPCPGCKVPVQKHRGCNHMVCPCGCEWCWICGVPWSGQCQELHWFI